MSRVCDLTGKRRQVANKVSHSNIKTKTLKQVNLHTKRVFDPETGKTVNYIHIPSSMIFKNCQNFIFHFFYINKS